jgi:hypothetical protein
MYAGAYAFGKTESRTKVINGRARKSEGHFKSRETWMVLNSVRPSGAPWVPAPGCGILHGTGWRRPLH